MLLLWGTPGAPNKESNSFSYQWTHLVTNDRTSHWIKLTEEYTPDSHFILTTPIQQCTAVTPTSLVYLGAWRYILYIVKFILFNAQSNHGRGGAFHLQSGHAHNKMELKDRLSLVFGSLKAKLQPVDDPPMKEEEYIPDGREERGTRKLVTSQRSHQFRERSRDHRHQCREGSRDHRHQLSERSRDHRPLRAPNYMHNPTKWTKYDLTDDGTSHQAGYDGLNDEQINRKAGLDFICSLRDSKAPHTDTPIGGYDETNDRKIVFKRSSKRTVNESSPGDIKIKKIKQDSQLTDHNDRGSTQSTDSGHYEGSVFKMPEYFVGLSNKSKRLSMAPSHETILNKPALPTHSVQLHLSHLEEEEEED